MDLEKLLRSVPITRRNTQYLFYLLALFLAPALIIYCEVSYTASPVDMELLLLSLFAGVFGFALVFIICLFLFPTRKQIKGALEKADYMFACISKLSLGQQETIKSEVQSVLGKVWRSKTYLTSGAPTYPKFGKYCLYGKVVAGKTFSLNQHVILPYQNITEVITGKPESGANKVVRTTFNALSIASGVLSTVTGSGSVFAFIEKRPTVVVVDDAGNTFQIGCANSDAFLEKLSKQLRDISA